MAYTTPVNCSDSSQSRQAASLSRTRLLIKSFLAAAEHEPHGQGQVWKRIAAAFEVWSVKPLEMIMAAPHADEMTLGGSGLAAGVYCEGREKLCQSLTPILQEANQNGEIDLKKAGLTVVATTDLIVAAAAGVEEGWIDVARYRKRLAGLLLCLKLLCHRRASGRRTNLSVKEEW